MIELLNDGGEEISQIRQDDLPSEMGEDAQLVEHDREKAEEVVLHSEKTELDLELDRMIGEKKRKPLENEFAFSLAAVPRLHGDENTVIDLETNEVKLREKSEVEKLQERFIAHTMPKSAQLKNKTEVSVFNPDIGGLETLKSSLSADPKPGQAYFSLKEELSKKINEKRRESLMKRIEEEKARRKEMEIDDAEEILDDEKMELSDSDVEDAHEEAEEKEAVEGEEEGDEDENQSEDEVETTEKPRLSRIVRAFEDDSDDEEAKTVEEKPAEGPCIREAVDPSQNATESSFNEQSQLTNADNSIGEEMREFESRLFDISTQRSALAESKTGSALYEGGVGEDEIDESQLMALCSGAFVTQKPEAVSGNSPSLFQMFISSFCLLDECKR